MTPEQKFYQWFRKQLPAGADCVRIETSTMGGMPDINVCYLGTDTWLELKVAVGEYVLIRPDQYAWINRRARAGGRCFILAQCGNNYLVWKFPCYSVTPRGKYLAMDIFSESFRTTDGKQLVNFLFT